MVQPYSFVTVRTRGINAEREKERFQFNSISYATMQREKRLQRAKSVICAEMGNILIVFISQATYYRTNPAAMNAMKHIPPYYTLFQDRTDQLLSIHVISWTKRPSRSTGLGYMDLVCRRKMSIS